MRRGIGIRDRDDIVETLHCNVSTTASQLNHGIFHPFQNMKHRRTILRIRRMQPQVLREGGLVRVWIFAAGAGAVLIDQTSVIG